MGNPARTAEIARQKAWSAKARQEYVEFIELRTIPTHLRIRILPMALWAEGILSMLVPHSVYLAHMLVREEMRKQQYGSPTGGSYAG